MPSIACIVEGEGEVQSVPVVIRRIGYELEIPLYVDVCQPIRVSKSSLVKVGGLEKWVEVGARLAGPHGGVVVLVDADGDCPKMLAGLLRDRAEAARRDLRIAVIVAVREFEAWFVAAAQSLSGKNGLVNSLSPPSHPEDLGDAKGWIKQHTFSHRYRETIDQPRLAGSFSLSQALACRSFRKFHKEIVGMLEWVSAA